jgi:hypothetical protein
MLGYSLCHVYVFLDTVYVTFMSFWNVFLSFPFRVKQMTGTDASPSGSIYIKPSTFAEKATFTALHHKAAVAALDPLLVKETAFKRVPFSSVIVTCAATGKQIKSGVVLCVCDKDS